MASLALSLVSRAFPIVKEIGDLKTLSYSVNIKYLGAEYICTEYSVQSTPYSVLHTLR